MKDCKYRLPCNWCDKHNRFCDMLEFEQKEYNEQPKECDHEWMLYSIVESGLKRFSRTNVYICTKCGERDIREE